MALQNKLRPSVVRSGALALSVAVLVVSTAGQYLGFTGIRNAGVAISLVALIAAATVSMAHPTPQNERRRTYDRAVVYLYVLYSASMLFLVTPAYFKLPQSVELRTLGTFGLGILVPLTYYLYSSAVGELPDALEPGLGTDSDSDTGRES